MLSLKKFLKNLRKRSRSATRLAADNLLQAKPFYGSDFSLYESSVDVCLPEISCVAEPALPELLPQQTVQPRAQLTYTANGERLRVNPESRTGKQEKVTLVGFSHTDTSDKAVLSRNFRSEENLYQPHKRNLHSGTAARTSREVKMERERLRRERLKSRLADGQPPLGCGNLGAAGNTNSSTKVC